MTLSIRNWFGRSLTRKFALLFAGFLLLQALQLGVGIFGILHVSQESAADSQAGKQRMRTYHLLYLVHEAMESRSWPSEGRKIVDGVLADYDAESDRLDALAGKLANEKFREAVTAARAHWVGELKPLLLAFDPSNPQTAIATLARFEAQVPGHVMHLEEVVSLLEQDTEEDTQALALFQAVLLGLTLLLGLVGVWLARRQVSQPLRRFIATTEEIAAGAYDRRVTVGSRDELGELGENFNRMVTAVSEKTARLAAFNRLAAAITSSLSIDEIIDQIMYHGIDVSGAKAACLAFYDEQTGRFNDWVTRGLSDHFVKNISFRPGGLADEAFTAGIYILSNDRPGTKHQLSKLTRDEGIRSFVCLPLTSHADRLGVIYFYRADRDTFLPEEIDLLKSFAHLAAVALGNARLYARLAGEARTDVLTGLYNRREFDGRLSEEHQRARRYAKPFALMMLDIDFFKRVNDDYGHAAGDAVLNTLAGILKKQFRDVDTVARYGGEEFTVILPEISGTIAKEVAERVRRAVAATPFQLPDGREIGLTVSIGVSCYPNCADNPQEVLRRTDQALYVAKEAGRNRVLLYRETLKARIEQDPCCIVAMLNESLDNIRPIVTAVSAKGAFFRKHTDMVEQVALQLAQVLRLSVDDTEALMLASRLHDLGMVEIPDAVLNKTGKLTDEEWAQVRRHPAVAADWLEQVPALKHLAPLVRHHHERYDGGGYPDGLKGEATPYLARVLAVADGYGSMISDWPGHTAKSASEALATLRSGAGTQFDPRIVTTFVMALEKKTD